MNKTDAKTIAMGNEIFANYTYNDVKKKIEKSDLSGISTINPNISRKDVARIMLAGFIGMHNHELNKIIVTTEYDTKYRCVKLNREGLALVNCLREFY